MYISVYLFSLNILMCIDGTLKSPALYNLWVVRNECSENGSPRMDYCPYFNVLQLGWVRCSFCLSGGLSFLPLPAAPSGVSPCAHRPSSMLLHTCPFVLSFISALLCCVILKLLLRPSPSFDPSHPDMLQTTTSNLKCSLEGVSSIFV